uniref:N/A n=1 Tax=Ganoderma boninense TaxID=34458 RepID=A0A5K1JYK9_9APHY|nr:N/A [Ganoderma boninense]
MATLLVLQEKQNVKWTWAFGFALTLESIAEYTITYRFPFTPSLLSVDGWTNAVVWMGRDLTALCRGDTVMVRLCYDPTPRQPPATSGPSGSTVPQDTLRQTNPSEATSPDSTIDTSTDTAEDDDQRRPEFLLGSSLIAVVTLALVETDTIAKAWQLLYEADGPEYPLERHWKKIGRRLFLPKGTLPRLYQVWDDTGEPVPMSEGSRDLAA